MQVQVNREFELARAMLDLLMNHFKQEQDPGSKRLSYVARTSVMKTIFAGVYASLVRSKMLPPFAELNRDIQNEYWSIADEFSPGGFIEDQYKFIHATIAISWLLENKQ